VTAALLEPFPTDWSRALCVVAHPDDLEYGAAVAVANWVRSGRSVSYLLVTRGEAGIDSLHPDDCGRVREAEERASAACVGVGAVDFLSEHHDGVVEYGLPLRRDLAAALRLGRPDIVVGIHFGLAWGGGAYNQADHRHVGLALLDAVRDAGNRWIFSELNEFSEPWSGTRLVAMAGSPSPTHAQPVTDADLTAGVDSLRCHELYLSALGGEFDPESFLTSNAVAAGDQAGVPLAVSFEVFRP